jgi:adenylate cyclase
MTDVTSSQPSAPGFLQRVAWSEMLRRFFNARAWGRWFNRSLVQTGRLTGLLAIILLFFVRVDDPNWLQFMRAKVFDTYQQIKPRALEDNGPVTIVDIDEKSIDALGQWPWPRTTIAALIDRLTELGAKVIAFDVVFAEPDRTSLRAIAESAAELDERTRQLLRTTKDNDEVFAEAIKRSGRVVLGQTIPDVKEVYAEERPTTSFVVVGEKPDGFMERYDYIQRNILTIDNAADGHGVFSVSSSFFDGIVRDVPMVLMADNVRYPSLSLEVLRLSLGARSIQIKSADNGIGIQELNMRPRGTRDQYRVPTDEKGRIKIYFTPHREYVKNYVSFVDVLNGTVDPARVKDKLILIGTSAQGLRDIRATPLDAVLPGVEVHANILENVISGTALNRPLIAQTIEVFAFIFVGLIIIIVTPMVNARTGALTFLALSGALIWASWYAFDQRRELYDPVFPIVVAFLFYSFLTYASFIREENQRKQIRGAFSQYLSPAVVEQLARDPSQLKLGGENREMTFMFSDIRGFTSISELFDAEGLTKLINRLLTPLTDVILQNNGTIDKYMGDCVMAFWNAPLKVPNHQLDACRASLSMVRELRALNATMEEEAKRENREHRPIAIGIGINSGIACVGNMGSLQRFDYSVLGDSVNLASRLEGQSKTYHSTVVLGESTAAQAQNLAILELDLIKVKGKATATRIFTLLGDEAVAASPEFKALKEKHDAMLKAYRSQNWEAAIEAANACKAQCAIMTGLASEIGGFYDMYLERIAEYQANPPGANWDAVYVATSK